MSYTRRYSGVASKTVIINYPKSESGGSISETVNIPVEVNIHVDTNPFDRSVNGCNASVNTLTGAVIAAKTAQIASISSNAQKVASAVIQGFFKNIRFEISSQITELIQKIESYLVHLHELSKQLKGIQAEMERDYKRTASHYVKIFDDLNKELSNRIYAIDQPAFSFKQNIDRQQKRITGNDMVSAIAVTGAEGGNLQARISASITKKRAFDAINQANVFLIKQKRLQKTIDQSMLDESAETTRFAPVCFMETCNENSQIGKSVFQPEFLPEMRRNSLIDNFQDKQWKGVSMGVREKIGQYFNIAVDSAYTSSDAHANRVRGMVMKLADFNSVKSINNI
jgi:hypothetical protein